MGPPLSVTGWAAVAAALLTQLADVWFLGSLTVALYWLDDRAPLVGTGLTRRRTALVLAVLLAAVATVTLLKPVFAVPRPLGHATPPPAPVPASLSGLYAWLSTADGYGFPSGHAVAAAAVWPALAWAVRVGRRRHRFGLAVVVVAVVAATRVLLGVHAPVDVAAGLLVGAVLFGVVVRSGEPAVGFLLGVVAAVGALAVTGPSGEAVVLTGLAAGATGTWWRYGDRVARSHSPRRVWPTTALGLALVAPLVVAWVLAPASVLAVLASLLAGAGVLAAPLVARLVDGAGR